MIKQLQIKKIIEFTKNWKHRDLLHILGGGLIALLPTIFLPKGLDILIGCWLCGLIGHLWEKEQVKSYEAEYSQKDILLTILGGLLIGILKFVIIN